MWPFSSSFSIPAAPPSPPPAATADKCPVDEATRRKWLAAQQSPNPLTTPSSSSPHSSSSQLPPRPLHPASLSEAREISTIPRHSSESLPQTADPHAAKSYTTPESSNWVYPSESQFYRAMERKNHNPNPADMKSIVPIHNAVNERAWKEVLDWEKGLGGESCGGVKLVTFKGTPGRWSPKSLANRLLFGYQPPFDTHRWIVNRCGTEVEYIIDFYTGKSRLAIPPPSPSSSGSQPDSAVATEMLGGDLSFFLDVRPALTSWEGVKTKFGVGRSSAEKEGE